MSECLSYAKFDNYRSRNCFAALRCRLQDAVRAVLGDLATSERDVVGEIVACVGSTSQIASLVQVHVSTN